MDISKLGYAKHDGERNLEEAHPERVSTDNECGHIANVIIDSRYTKGQPTIDANIFFIISGGSEREKDYFQPINKNSRRVKIAFVSKRNQGLNPKQLFEKAEEFIDCKIFTIEKDAKYHIEDNDMIFLLQDVDEYYKDLQCLIQKSKEYPQLKWIVSNPSFEIWLYYHYFSELEHLTYGLSLDVSKRSKWLKTHLHEIISGGVQTKKVFYDVQIAIANSLKNYREDDNGFPMVYSTQMHILASNVLSAMGTELEEMIEQRTKDIEYFRKILRETT